MNHSSTFFVVIILCLTKKGKVCLTTAQYVFINEFFISKTESFETSNTKSNEVGILQHKVRDDDKSVQITYYLAVSRSCN